MGTLTDRAAGTLYSPNGSGIASLVLEPFLPLSPMYVGSLGGF